MTSESDSSRVAGTLLFLAELYAFAQECAATGVWDDDLSTRRRQRDGAPSDHAETAQANAL